MLFCNVKQVVDVIIAEDMQTQEYSAGWADEDAAGAAASHELITSKLQHALAADPEADWPFDDDAGPAESGEVTVGLQLNDDELLEFQRLSESKAAAPGCSPTASPKNTAQAHGT